MTARFFCSTGLCTLQAAQLCHAAQREAELRARVDWLERALADAQQRGAQAQESADFYMDLFLSAKEATHGR